MSYRLRDHAQIVRLATLKDEEYRELSLRHSRELLDAFLKRDAEAAKDITAHNLRMAASSYYATQESLLRSASE